MHFRRFLGMVFHFGIPLALATAALGQVRGQPANIWIEITSTGELRVVGHFEFPQVSRDMAGSGGMWQD